MTGASPPEGPHVRLGLAWAAVTLVATAAGPVALAVVLAPVAALAAAQAARSRRRRRRRPAWRVAAGGAALVVLASAAGPLAVAAALVLLAVLLATPLVLAGPAAAGPRRHAPALTGILAAGFGLAGAAPVLLRSDGFIAAFVLLSLVHVYDASAYVVGSGAQATWEGPAAGVAGIAAVTLAVAAVLSPPFRGQSPWLLGLLAAALTPLGPVVANGLLGDERARVPAVCRLDSLLVVGPAWALAASLAVD